MLVAITHQRIAQAQAAATDGFTINDAADVILAQVANSARLGVAVDPFDLATQVAPLLGIGLQQELGLVKAVLNRAG